MLSLTNIAILSSMAGVTLADIYPATIPPAADGGSFFTGPQSGIGSWYRATAGADSTNGKSWCGYTYFNSDPVFAVSLKKMGGATFNSNPTAWRQQTQKYCGLEAKVTDPKTGKTMLMYLGDAFDDAWVKTPSSIDIMIDAFSNIHGNPNGDKNNVINPVNWEWTGRVNTKYAAPGASWPSASTTAASPTTPVSSKPAASPTSGTCAGCEGASCNGQTTVCNSGLTCLSPDGVCKKAACNWGCAGWSCSSDSPCQKPNTCDAGTCKAPAAGTVGASCDGQTTVCNAGLTCLSPDGYCRDAACNWGCTGWSCSASAPCQKPNSCVSGTCTSA